MSLVVIPDIHGEYKIIEQIVQQYQHYRYIFLGDIVDRGESSFLAFQSAWNIIAQGRADIVRSNHDYKLYRWFKKFRANTEQFPSDYGMSPSHGMRETLNELETISSNSLNWYSNRFITMWEDYAKDFIWYDNHVFAHAGFWPIHTTKIVTKKQFDHSRSDAIFRTIHSISDLDWFDDEIRVHLGHWVEEPGKIVTESFNNHSVTFHDIGIGKHIFTKDFDINSHIQILEVNNK